MPAVEPRAWVFNLDAEDELAHGHAHTPSRATRARVEGLLEGPLGAFLSPGDVVVWPGERAAAGLEGVAWCPTRWALAALERAGARAPAAPPQAVLRQVNHRRFSQELGTLLPGAGWARAAAAVEALLADVAALERASVARSWVLKRPFGYAGRGRKKLRPGARTAEEQAWLDATLAAGEGVAVEPYVERLADFALHGLLPAEGAPRLGEPTAQVVDATGAWQASRRVAPGELSVAERAALHEEAARASEALRAAGYFGPFGLDAYRWRDAAGAVHFQPRSEVNARYSMGWAVGLGA